MIDFRVLGPLELKGPDGEDLLSVLSQPKRVALLAYLALATGQSFRRRDTIIGIFWPDLDQDRARGALRKSLYFLRRSVGEGALKGRGDEEVALDRAEVACDVVDFEDALKEDEQERALELYRGDLLEGLFLSGSPEFEKWLDGERERLREMAARAAWALAHRYLSSGRVTDGERMGQRALALVPTDENEVQRFIKGLNDAGDRAAAVRFYEKFAKELEELLDLRPAAETRALVKGIRDTLGTPVPPAAPTHPSSPATPTHPSPVGTPASPSGSPPKTELFHRVKEALSHRYGIEREIGRGGMATVFLAEDPKHRRKVALKVLDPELAEALGGDRFLREIEIAANLTHPHILPLFDSGEADGLLYYVMPFVEGESLRSRLERERQLPVADAVAITREVASALAFAHEKGVIHRDVKPANILLESGHAVLADFGIAHAVALAGETRQTRSGVSLGTPAYMSPEQSTGETDLDGRSDQYGLGCVLYEMLAGDQPFRGSTGESVARQHLTRDPHAITDLRPSVPEGMASALHRAMEKAPADRFSSMRGFADALKADTASSTQRPRAASGAKEKKALLRSPRFWGLCAVGLVVVVASALFLGSLVREPSTTAAIPPRQIVVTILPFAPVPEGIQNLSGGMATLMSIGLDGVGGLRVVDWHSLFPHVGTFASGERLPLAEVRNAAEQFGVTHFVLGEGVRTAEGEVTLAAMLYSVEEGSEAIQKRIVAVGSDENPQSLADDLTRLILGNLQVTTAARLAGTAALTTESLSALQAWWRGEAEFRSTRYAEAFDSFHEAVRADPTFALAHYRKSLTALMILKFDEAQLAAAEALRRRSRLNTRDRNLVEAWAALIRGSAQEAQRLYKSILDDYPDEVEALFGLGTAQVYFNPILGNSTAEAEAQFRRVLELSPNFGQARFHLLEFATRSRHQAAFDSLKGGVDPGSDQALAWDAVRAFWFGGREEQQRIEDRFLRVDPVEAGLAVGRVAAFLQDHQAAEELATLLTGPDQDEETRTAAHFLVAMTRFAQGRWTDGMASLDHAGEFSPAWAIEMKALLTGSPPRTPSSEELVTVLETLREWDADVGSTTNFVLFAHNRYHSYLRTYLLALTSTWAGDSEAAQAYAAELGGMPRSPELGAVTRSWAEGIVARIFASRGETAEAVRRLTVAPPDVPLWLISISPFFSRSFDRYALGELLRDTGRTQDALRWFRTLTEGHELVLVGPAFLQMAEIEEELGNTTDALEHYRRFVELWENADDEFLPLLNEARAKIAQLTGSS